MLSPHCMFVWLLVVIFMIIVIYSIQPNYQCEPVDRLVSGKNYQYEKNGLCSVIKFLFFL